MMNDDAAAAEYGSWIVTIRRIGAGCHIAKALSRDNKIKVQTV
jgi:hypothetical protein